MKLKLKSVPVLFILIFSFVSNIYAWPVNVASNLTPAAPIANGVKIIGRAVPGQILTGQYIYHDATGSNEKASEYQWVSLDSEDDLAGTVVGQGSTTSETGAVYLVTDADVGKYISFDVTPKADRAEATVGTQVHSPARLVNKAQATINFYVAPDGNDAGEGTLDKPFKTIAKAQKKIEELKNEGGLGGGVNVFLRGGTYLLSQGLKFNDHDSGTENAPIVYSAYQNENVQIEGGVDFKASGFKRVNDKAVLKRLPKASHGKVFQVDLGNKGVTKIGAFSPDSPNQLFFNDSIMQISRYPYNGTVQVPGVVSNQSGGDASEKAPADRYKTAGATIGYDDPEVEKWTNPTDCFIFGRLMYEWSAEYAKVLAIDTQKKTISLSESYYGVSPAAHYYYLNILEEIANPGEWYLDRAKKILYFYPPEALGKNDKIQMSLLSESAITCNNASHITFKGLNISLIAGDGVTVNNGTDILFDGCNLSNVSGQGFAINNATGCGVVNSEITKIGLNGIRLTGGDRAAIIPSGDYIENNNIHDFNRAQVTFNGGISVDGVGITVSHNKVYDAPHTGIVYSLADSVIQYNEVFDVGRNFGDIGAVYTGQDWASRGNTIRYNYIHDVNSSVGGSGSHGLYLDDQTSEFWVYGNVFNHISSNAIFCNLGRDNIIENNMILNSGVAFCGQTDESKASQLLSGGYMLKKFNRVDNTKEPWVSYYPAFANYTPMQLFAPDYNILRNNIIYKSGDITVADSIKTHGVIENNFMTAQDVGFVDAANGDYTLKDDAAAYSDVPGFKSIPFKDIGIYGDKLTKALDGSIAMMIGSPAAISNNTMTYIDSKNMNVAPLVKDGAAFVPLRFTAESLGAKVAWDAENQKIDITTADKSISFVLGSDKVSVNGAQSKLNAPPETINGTNYMPLVELAQILNEKVSCDTRGLILMGDNVIDESNDMDKTIADNIIRELRIS